METLVLYTVIPNFLQLVDTAVAVNRGSVQTPREDLTGFRSTRLCLDGYKKDQEKLWPSVWVIYQKKKRGNILMGRLFPVGLCRSI
ncbi:MAG: hypothetical protein LBS20_17865 [Prevotella sp.]|jgi:hypothetical protein|nr:hypothetical protein [Prevotella sp.]